MDNKYKIFVWWGIGLAGVTTVVYFLTKPPKGGSTTVPPKTIPKNNTTTTTAQKPELDPFEKQPLSAENFNLNDLDDGHELSGVANSTGLGGFNFNFDGYYDSSCGCIQDNDGGQIEFRDVKKLVNSDNGEVLFNYL